MSKDTSLKACLETVLAIHDAVLQCQTHDEAKALLRISKEAEETAYKLRFRQEQKTTETEHLYCKITLIHDCARRYKEILYEKELERASTKEEGVREPLEYTYLSIWQKEKAQNQNLFPICAYTDGVDTYIEVPSEEEKGVTETFIWAKDCWTRTPKYPKD